MLATSVCWKIFQLKNISGLKNISVLDLSLVGKNVHYHCCTSSFTAWLKLFESSWYLEASKLSMLNAFIGFWLCGDKSDLSWSSRSSSLSLSSPTTSISCSRIGSLFPPFPPFLAASHSCLSCEISTMMPLASNFFCCFSSWKIKYHY